MNPRHLLTSAGVALLLTGTSMAQVSGADFRHRERASGESWLFRWESQLELRTRVHLGDELVVDHTDRYRGQDEWRLETRAAQGEAPAGWRVITAGKDELSPPTVREAFLEQGILYYWDFSPPGSDQYSTLMERVGAFKDTEPTLLRAAGLTERPLLWDWIPEGSMPVGTSLPFPASLAQTLLSSEDLEVLSMEATLTEVREHGEAVLQVRARLVGESMAGSGNSIPSESRVDLEGTLVIDTHSTRPLLLDLTGPMQVSGEGQQEDLSVRVAGDGEWRLTLSWIEEA